MAWAVVYIVMAVVAAGSYWYASSLDYPDYSDMNKANDTTVSAVDSGIGFAPFGQYPASELPVPVIYGKARLNGLVVHARPYGDNYEKCHYILLFGDKGYSIEQLFVDKYPIEQLPNWWENSGSGIQDSTNTWYNAYPLGGSIQISLNNSATFGVMMSTNTPPDTITASTSAILYGGGTIKCRSLHTWPQESSGQVWSWKLTNVEDPSDVIESETYEEVFTEYQYIDGGDKADDASIHSPGSVIREHTFEVSQTLSEWSVELVLYYGEVDHPSGPVGYNGDEGAQTTLYSFEITDIGCNEIVEYNATIVYCHLVKDESLTSNQPVVNAEVQKSEHGNPAQSLYEYLTDTSAGLGLNNVDYPSAMDMVSWCDTEEYYYNRAVTAFYSDSQILKEMCTSGRIILYEENGKVKMRPDKVELVTYPVDDTEIEPGSLKIGINAKTSSNRVEGQYTEPFYGYTIERIYAEDYEDIAETGKRTVTLGLAGVTSQLQAHNLTHLALNHITKSKYWCSFTTGMETAAMFKIADVIEVTSETNSLIDGKKWRVQKITEKDLFSYDIYCKQYDDTIYDFPVFSPWYEETTELGPIHGWPGPQTGPAPVINVEFEYVEFPDGCSLTTEIELSWINPTERFDSVTLFCSHNNIDWRYIGNTTSDGCSFIWRMRYGTIYIKLVSIYEGLNNETSAPIVSHYVTGDPSCMGTDYPGYGRGQYSMQPYGA